MKHNLYAILFSLICLLSTTNLHAQTVPNNGFENWTNDPDGNLNPDLWMTSNASPDTSVFRYTPAYAGNYSLQVKAFYPGFTTISGSAYIDFPLANKPNILSLCLKSTVMPGDLVYVMMGVHSGDSAIAAIDSCTFKIDSTMSDFRCFDFPIRYIPHLVATTGDSVILMIVAGKLGLGTAQLGTEVIVDQIAFGFPTGNAETKIPLAALTGRIYPNPASNNTIIPLSLTAGSDITIYIYDLRGQKVKTIESGFITPGEHLLKLPVNDLAAGIYTYSIQGNDFIIPGRIVVNK